MIPYKCEYIWLDGNETEPKLRSKTKIVKLNEAPSLKNLPACSFDGALTDQAPGCQLAPVKIWEDGGRFNGLLVLCEVKTSEGRPHKSNHRSRYKEDKEFWFGFDQEYVIKKDGRLLGLLDSEELNDYSKSYCAIGHENVAAREFVEEHLNLCLCSGINITDNYPREMIGQWGFHTQTRGAKAAADDLWMARFLLLRIAEKHGLQIDFRSRAVESERYHSGLYTTFSNSEMRLLGGEKYFQLLLKKLEMAHEEHLACYGYEGAYIGKDFSYAVNDRNASISIPSQTVENDWRGRLEDRRPAANACPYQVVARILNTIPILQELPVLQEMI